VDALGEDYVQYRRDVPMIIPSPRLLRREAPMIGR
jgi:protein-S-isoprenylcysteine O-methyltransferase Ste14